MGKMVLKSITFKCLLPVDTLCIFGAELIWVTECTGLYFIIGTSSGEFARWRDRGLLSCVWGDAFHHWLVGHSTEHLGKDLEPRLQASLCQIIPWEMLFVCVRGHERVGKKLWRQSWALGVKKAQKWTPERTDLGKSENNRVNVKCVKSSEQLLSYVQTILLHIYITKYSLHFFTLCYEKRRQERGWKVWL